MTKVTNTELIAKVKRTLPEASYIMEASTHYVVYIPIRGKGRGNNCFTVRLDKGMV